MFDFIQNYPFSILHYVCDSVDLKQNARSKLFDLWYNKCSNEEFSKLDLTYKVEKENIEYKLEFIFKTDLYDITKVKENIVNQINEFSSFK